MNKKPHRSNVHAPTTKPEATITQSATLAVEGEFPLSASHDVLQAALAPQEDAAPVTDDVTDAADTVIADTAGDRKPGKKPAKPVAKAPVEEADSTPVKAAKAPKIKFVKIAFALPESEAELLTAMKKTHAANGLALKKSQLLRAALLALADIDAERLAQLLAHLPVAPRASQKKK